MLLAMDVGNTNIKVGLFENGSLLHSWRMTSNRHVTADELGIQMESFFQHLSIPTEAVDGIVMSSVIPSMNYTIEHMFSIYFSALKPLMVDSSLKLGFVNGYEHPATLGSDRICNAVATLNLYGGPAITIDFGTATNFIVLSKDARFIGGVICPGFQISTDALIEHAEMLHKVEYIKPPKLICTNTERSIQAGIIYGYVGQIEYLIKRLKREIGAPCRVIATGGMSSLIASETDSIDVLNRTLTLEGLRMIYDMNKG
ncbi:MAG: type III pantothenate kinase [Bacillota bacterium]